MNEWIGQWDTKGGVRLGLTGVMGRRRLKLGREFSGWSGLWESLVVMAWLLVVVRGGMWGWRVRARVKE
ncbi:hypothetical protein, partial [Micrococcus luteus]|uniref:hypothetical protein n=1 Tax=Micrococcus luteus TaxID=1270 RepID=UPI001C92FEE9